MRRRAEGLVEALLRLAPLAPPGLRTWAGRRAAARNLGQAALRAAPADPVVLARLGLHRDAIGARGGGRAGRLARAASAAALGDLAPLRELKDSIDGASPAERRLLARCVAPNDPGWAMALAPAEDALARAACALAAGRTEALADLLATAPRSRETSVLEAGLAAASGDWRAARRAFNAAFTLDGATAPLDAELDSPPLLSSFGEIGSARLASTAGGEDAPLVSVVVPAHDAAASLALAARSLLAQTWRNLELIIVDDRSTDATPAVARVLAEADRRVRMMDNRATPGAYGARNTGAAAARGALIAFHDADDWAHPERLERQIRALSPNAAMSAARYFRLDEGGHPVSPRVFPLIRLSPMALLVRAEAWRAAGPFEETFLGADSEWLARFDERFGRRAGVRLAAIGFVAGWSPRSLSGSATTGMHGAGLERRLSYEHDWRWRHAGLR